MTRVSLIVYSMPSIDVASGSKCRLLQTSLVSCGEAEEKGGFHCNYVVILYHRNYLVMFCILTCAITYRIELRSTSNTEKV